MKNTTALVILCPLLAIGMLGLAVTGRATPYASGLSNYAGTISFRLNESADNVKVISSGGANTNDLGALAAGLHTFALGISEPYQVEVFKVSPVGFTTPVAPNRGAVLQISTDNNLVRFNNPRGLTVNTDPASPYFGRVYVANGAAGTTGGRNVGDGIYVLNSDLSDALGQGDTPRTGGLDFGAGGDRSPYRLDIGQDNNLYIADWSDATGSVYVTDPNVSGGSGQNVLGGPAGGPFPVTSARIHGSIAGIVVEGSLGGGNLTAYVVDEDLQDDRDSGPPAAATQRESLWRHDIGASLPGPFVMPTLLAMHPNSFLRSVSNQVMDLARGPDQTLFVSNYRSVGNEPNVWVVDTNGVVIWNSLVETRAFLGTITNDLLRATGGMDVSPNGDYLAVINIETNGMYILPMLDGIPDLTNRLLLTGFSTTTAQGRDVTFDLAGNLYAVSSGAGLLRVFSPGGTSTAITGSDGTFTLVTPPRVRVEALDAQGSEDTNTITFNIWRDGGYDAPLTVNYTLTGTAANGVDYATNVLSITIPAGETNVAVVITPLDDGLGEGPETVVLTLIGTAQYNIAAPITATGIIADDEAVLSVEVIDDLGYETAGDPIVFNVWRTGSTAAPLTFTFILTGAAGNGVDYETNVLSGTILAGETNVLIIITPIDDGEAELTESVILTLAPGAAYTIDPPNNRRGYIADNENPVVLRVTASDSNAYERFPSDTITYTITRLGDTNTDQFIVFEWGGTATLDVDFMRPSADLALYLERGVVTTNYTISPIDDFEFEGDETATFTLLPNDGYVVEAPGSASGRIRDDEYGPETILFADNLNSNTSADWLVRFGANNGILDYSLDWVFDYATLGIPPAPGSLGADTIGVRMAVNKTNATASGSAGINLYPRDRSFSGDYALRFDLYLSFGATSTTEHGLAGINHSGLLTNRVSQSTTAGNSTRGTDGIWVAIENDGSANRPWAAYTSTNANTAAFQITNRTAGALASVITSPPYFAAGSPGNTATSANKAWADVELSQVGSTVTLKVNKNVICQFQNSWGFTNGTIMIGHNDQFDSVGSVENVAIFDNVRVVRLGIEITDVRVSGSTVELDFTSSDAGDFRVDSTATLSPPAWSEETSATITPTATGYTATAPATGAMRFYRVRR